MLPWLLARWAPKRSAAGHRGQHRQLAADAAGLTLTAFAITQPVVNLEPGVTINAAPAAFACADRAVRDDHAAARGLAEPPVPDARQRDRGDRIPNSPPGCPLIVELGASLDVLFAVIVGVTGRLRRISAIPTCRQKAAELPGIDGQFAAPRPRRVASLITGWRRTTATLVHDGAGLRCGDKGFGWGQGRSSGWAVCCAPMR